MKILGPRRQFWAVFALAFLFVPRGAAQAPPQEGCKSEDSAKIVRIDDRNERIFVVAQEGQISTSAKARKLLLPLQAFLKQCRPDWGKTWAVSFFSDAKYAGYKSDENIASLVANGSWSKHYLAEYERQTQRLILNPAERDRIKFLRVPLP